MSVLTDSSFVIDSILDYAIYQLSLDGVIETWNLGAERLKGYSRQEIVGKHFSIFYLPADIRNGNPFKELHVAAEQGRYEEEGWRIRKDGTTFWANVVLTRIRDPNSNKVKGFVKITRDITERKTAEAKQQQQQNALIESEERQRLLIDSVLDYALYMIDTTGAVTSWNTGAERLKGYTAQEVIGRHFSLFYSIGDIKAQKPEEELVIATSQGRCEAEGWRVRKDGSHFWANVILTSIKSDNRIVGYAKITRDMTERKSAQEHLYRQQQVMGDTFRQLDATKTLFLQQLSHELRSPLQPVTLIISSLLERASSVSKSKLVLPADVIEDHKLVLKCVQQQLSLIDDLLDSTRLTTGKLLLKLVDADIHTVLKDAVQLASKRDEHDKEIRFVMHLDAPDSRVMIDIDRMHQVFSNLLRNAIKFCPESGAVITIKTEQNDDMISIQITDNGAGISPIFLPSLFQAFAQQCNAAGGGLGLGLAIAKGLVDLHHGEISAHSDGTGKGSTFQVTLPRSQTATKEHLTSVNIRRSIVHRTDSIDAMDQHITRVMGSWKVLLVEDDMISSKILARTLRSFGIRRVDVVTTVAQAVEKTETCWPYHLLVCDMNLPDGTGIDVINSIKTYRDAINDTNDFVTLVCSATSTSLDIDRSMAAGFGYHLVKPVSRAMLVRALYQIIQSAPGGMMITSSTSSSSLPSLSASSSSLSSSSLSSSSSSSSSLSINLAPNPDIDTDMDTSNSKRGKRRRVCNPIIK